MNVWLISNMYPSDSHPYFGVFVKNIANGLMRNNVSIIRKSIMHKSKSKYHKLVHYFCFFLDVLFYGLKSDYDVIYIHFVKYSFFPAFIFKYLKKIRIIYNFHGTDVLVYGVFRKLLSWVVRHADLVVVPSEPLKRAVVEKFCLKDELIFISPSGGIDEKFFPYPKTMSELGINIGFVSNIVRMKGWEVLLDSFSGFIEKHPTASLLIAGNGPDVAMMLERIERLQLSDRCRYLGAVIHDELVKIYNKLTFLVFPSFRESLGLVGLEAMACGVPVIGSDIEGINSYLIDGLNGYLFEPGNSIDLLRKMELYISSDMDVKSVLRRNAIYTAEQYKASPVAEKLTKKFLSLCG